MLTLSEWIDKYNKGKFESFDFSKAVKAGWTDWNCPEKRLLGKTRKCAKILCRITDPELLGGKIELCNVDEGLDRISLEGLTIDIPSVGYSVTVDGETTELEDAASCIGFVNGVRHRACFRTGEGAL
jgi:hypothetical protein